MTFRTIPDGDNPPPKPASAQPLPNRFIVVITAPGHEAALRQLSQFAHVVHIYDSLPLVEVETDVAKAGNLVSEADVHYVFQALGNVDASRTFAWGFNLLVKLARDQREIFAPFPSFSGRSVGSAVPYPDLAERAEGWQIVPDASRDWPTAPGIVPVLNLSLGPRSPGFPFLPNDLVNLATYSARNEMLVVLSAGNWGDNGMSAWALASWVLAVGATEDEEGLHLAAYSSRGRPEDPTSGPDVVAWGASLDEDGHVKHVGTSFSAPRVCRLAMLITAALLQLSRHIHLEQGAPPHGVPLVGAAWIDEYGGAIWKPKGLQFLPGLPILGVKAAAVHELVEVTQAAGLELSVHASPQMLRRLLLDSAAPVPGRRPHEVGAGFVDLERVTDHLANLTGLELVRLLAGPEGIVTPIPEDVTDALRLIRVFDAPELALLFDAVNTTGPVFRYDYRTARWAYLPVSDAELAAFTFDERIYGLDAQQY